MQTYEDYLPDALEIVSAWEIPEEEFAQVVNDQARLMAGSGVEPTPEILFTSPYLALQF
ncbi:hypothetical protein [Seongchinamella unica]|uniref:hypothetical protein n=1 Tax=Seongchinamella unica TaxID=2547392 RepID=UPI001404CD65|nr:hypothetical protein [Seongchinamella unica]